jgi:hypothetical protein
MHEIRFLNEMDTSILGRVTALLNRDLGRRRVIFLALARGHEIICIHFDNRFMIIYGHGSLANALPMRRNWSKD